VGTAGIGKLRLAHEFVGPLRQNDWQVLEAEGSPLERAVPNALLKKLLQSALQVGNIAPENQTGSREEPASAHADLWPAALCSVVDARHGLQIKHFTRDGIGHIGILMLCPDPALPSLPYPDSVAKTAA
jgi:hypothetical protein